MTKPRVLFLAAACTMTGAGGAFATDAVVSSAKAGHGHGHGERAARHQARALEHRAAHVARRAVHVEATIVTKDGLKKAVVDRGVVKSVAGSDVTITEGRKTATQDVTVSVPSGAHVHVDGKKAAIGDVKAGMRVLVAQLPGRTVVIARTPKS